MKHIRKTKCDACDVYIKLNVWQRHMVVKPP